MDQAYQDRIHQQIQAWELQGRRRQLRTVHAHGAMRIEREGRHLVNFSSNDYLGLASDPRMRDLSDLASGAGASRLVCGTLPAHDRLEASLAFLKGTETALVMGSGFQTNLGVIAALLDPEVAGPHPQVFIDRLGHASMYEGLKGTKARVHRFHHNDMNHLEAQLRAHPAEGSLRLILTESVFSMDGDRAPLPRLADLAEHHDAVLYVDEAHATGMLGPGGAGCTAAPEVKGRIDLVMGTFGKALGGYGSFLACDAVLQAWMVNRCRSFIYSTALPPPCVALAQRALALIPGMDPERAFVAAQSERVRQHLRHLGLDPLASSTHIIPAVLGSDADTMAAAQLMEACGILAVAIRPPTVPPGTGRLRISLSAAHTLEDIDQLLHALTRLGKAGA